MKRLLCIWVSVMLICSVFYVAPVAAAVDPYAGINALDFDGKKVDNRFRTDEGCLGAMYASHYVYYKDVDFGDTPPTSVTVSIGVPEAYVGSIELCLDSPTSSAIATIVPQACNWLKPVDNTVDLTREVKGKHDLYLVVKSNTQNIFSIKFNRPAGDGIYSEYTDEPMYNDITDNKYKHQIEMISQLGLMQTESSTEFRPALTVTKGKFADMIYKIWNGKPLNYEPFYSDIPEDSEFAEACVYLRKFGILPPDETEFHPYQYITAYDAAVLLCRAMGYADLIDNESAALKATIVSSSGLLKGITGQYLKRDACAAMLYNALMEDSIYISAIEKEYSVNKSGILGQTQDIYHGSGIVNKTCISGLYSPDSDVPFGSVTIDGIQYYVGETKAASYLGYNCDYFYHDDDGIRTLVAILPNKSSQTLWINDDKLTDISDDGISYTNEKGRTKKIKFSSDSKIIYNGKALDGNLSSAMDFTKPFQGKIRCIDNGSGYDTFFIDSYFNMVVSGVDSNGFMHDEPRTKNVDLEADQLVLQRDGNEATPLDVAAGDTAVVYTSANSTGKKLVRVYLRSEMLEGNVTTIKKGNGEDKIGIDDVMYQIASEGRSINYELNSYGEFYINVYNEIFGFTNKSDVNMKVGFLLAIQTSADDIADSGFEIKLKDSDGKINIFKTASNVVIDGNRCKTQVQYLTSAGALTVDVPVRYALNDDGLLRMLDTPQAYSAGATLTSSNTLVELTSALTEFIYNKTNRLLILYNNNGIAKYGLSKEAKIFSLWNGSKSEDVTIDLPQNISGDGIKKGRVYSLTGDGNVGDLFLWTERAEKWSYPAVTHKKTTAVSEDGEILYRLHGYVGSTEVVHEISESVFSGTIQNTFNAIDVGDCFRVRLDSQKRVCDIELVYLHDGANIKNGITPLIYSTAPLNGDSLQYDRYLFSKVIEKKDGFIKVSHTTAGVTTTEIINVDGLGVCSYETDRSTPYIKTGLSYANINVGDSIFTYAENASTKTVVIYGHSH